MIRFAWTAALVALAATAAATASARADDLLQPTPERLMEMVELGNHRNGLTLSPDGALLAVIERRIVAGTDRFTHTVIVIPVEGGAPRRVGDGGDIILSAPGGYRDGFPVNRIAMWSPDSRRLAWLARRDDTVQLWISDVAAGEARLLAGPPGDVARFAWLPDGRGLVIETLTPRARLAAEAAEAQRLGFRADDDVWPAASLRPVARVDAGRSYSVVSLQGALRSATSSETALIAAAPPRTTPPRVVDEAVGAGGARTWIQALDPNSTLDIVPLGVNFRAHAAAAPVRCSHAACSGRLEHVWLSGDATTVYVERWEGVGQSYPALYAWRPHEQTVTLLRREDERLIDCSVRNDTAYCLQEAPLQPRRVAAIDLRTGALTALYDPNPDWRRMSLTRMERIDAKDVYGEDTFAHLVFPARHDASRRYPLVIVQYRSRGFLRGGVGGEHPIHALAARGFFVLSVDRPEALADRARMTAAEQRSKSELTSSEQISKQSGLEAMISLLDRRGLIDTRRIGITGMSDGAETVFWGLTQSGVFAVAVVSGPPTDASAWWLNPGSFRRVLRAKGNNGPWPDAPGPWTAWWRSHAIAPQARAITAPLLMNLSDAEALMALPLLRRLEDARAPVEAYIYPDAYHAKWRPQQILKAQHRAIDWLDFWLNGAAPADRDDPERLARWNAMRAAKRTDH